MPKDDELAAGRDAYLATAGRPQNQPFAKLLFENGLQRPDGIETDLGTAVGSLRQNIQRGEHEDGDEPYSERSGGVTVVGTGRNLNRAPGAFSDEV